MNIKKTSNKAMPKTPKTSVNADTRPIYVMLPQDLYVRLRTRCARDRVSLKSAISQAIFDYLDKGE